MSTADPTTRVRAVESAEDLATLLAAAEDSSPDVARAALHRIAAVCGPEACEPLRELLWSCDLSIARDVVRALRQLGDTRLRDEALAGLRDPLYLPRLVAVWVLEALGDSGVVESVEPLLSDEVSGVRASAAEALVKLRRDGRSAQACAALLADPEPDVRRRAVGAIGRCAGPIETVLAPIVGDPNPLVRREAAMLASRLPRNDAVALLHDRDVQVRVAACRRAGRRETVELCDVLRRDNDAEVRLAAAHTLGGLAMVETVPALIDALGDRAPVVRAASLWALTEMLDRGELLAKLSAQLEDRDPRRRRTALYTLQHLRAAEVSLPAQLLRDPDPDVRLAVAHVAPALGRDARQHLEVLLGDPDAEVRHAAELALQAAR